MNLSTYAAELNKSAHKYKKKLMQLPSIGIEEAVKYMTGYPGVTYKQTVGEIFADAELRPYDGNNNAAETAEIQDRTLETFLGSCVELFDPNQLRQTIYATLQTHTDTISDAEIRRGMLFAIMDSVLSKLNSNLWTAVRNDSGSKTSELFNGFDTITSTEKNAGNIASNKGNYEALSDAIDSTNAYDQLKAIYRNMSDELKAQKSFMFVPFRVSEDYDDDYLTTVGATPYNRQFNKRFVEGSGGLCEIVPLVGKAKSSYIHVSTKSNLMYGYGAGVENENIEIRRGDNAFKLQLILAMFFGTQFATIDKKRLYVAEMIQSS
ncbi:MAG: hypothetical protein V5A47_09445 [Bacteroidales bacterium]